MTLEVDVVIVGGGIAGLWMLDEVRRRGYSALLLESSALGAGQTIASQGILHGGLKYSLGGLIDPSSKAIADMPARWKASLCGEAPPDLRGVRVLSPCCHLWRTGSVASRIGMMAAKAVIRTTLEKVPPSLRPDVLRDCPGDVLRVDEPVVDPCSLLEAFACLHGEHMALYEGESLVFEANRPRTVIRARTHGRLDQIELQAGSVIFCAGEGNSALRCKAGLGSNAMQTRPLHMVMVRGQLPSLYGHCVDGSKTRATITTATHSTGDAIWMVGGEIAESGVTRTEADQIAFARQELRQVLPGIDFNNTQWLTYRINRAEGRMPGNRRPEGTVWQAERSFVTAWPTKLVLAPQLAREIADTLPRPNGHQASPVLPPSWPKPTVAPPPWERVQWTR